MQKQLILASKSSRRQQLLENVGLKFKIIESNINESLILIVAPKKYAENLSKEKAKAVAKKYRDAIIIGADTIVVFKGEIIGKPSSLKNAKEILRKLSGQRHTVITGFTVLDSKTNKLTTNSVLSYVVFKKLSEEEINAYVRSKEPMDKAGAYAIQGKAGALIEKVEGDFFNVVGLPIFALCKTLREFGINISRY